MVGILTVHLRLPACSSLKEKRGHVKPLLARLRREFNISVAEMDLQDRWQETVVACGMVGNNAAHIQSSLQMVQIWINANWPDGMIVDGRIEII